MDGLFQYLTRDTGYRTLTTANVRMAVENDLLPKHIEADLIESIVNGSIKDSILNGPWELLPGFKHILNKTGCAFMTSTVVKWILSFDPCEGTGFRTMTFVCPFSCGCGSKTGCPRTCHPGFNISAINL